MKVSSSEWRRGPSSSIQGSTDGLQEQLCGLGEERELPPSSLKHWRPNQTHEINCWRDHGEMIISPVYCTLLQK